MADMLNSVHAARDALRFALADLNRIANDLEAVGLNHVSGRIDAVSHALAPLGDALIKAWDADITSQMEHSQAMLFGIVDVATHFLESKGKGGSHD